MKRTLEKLKKEIGWEELKSIRILKDSISVLNTRLAQKVN